MGGILKWKKSVQESLRKKAAKAGKKGLKETGLKEGKRKIMAREARKVEELEARLKRS